MSERRIVSLSDVLTEARSKIEVSPDRVYPMAGVFGFGRGVLLREPSVRGEDISATHLFEIAAGQIIYSRLKAFEGAFALVTNEADGRFVTNEFPTFDVDRQQAEPEYIALLLAVPTTWSEISQLITGVGARRERLQVRDFLDFVVELPSVGEQRLAVARIGALTTQALACRAQAATLRQLANACMRRAVESGSGGSLPVGTFATLDLAKVDVVSEGEYLSAGVKIAGEGLFSRGRVKGADTNYPKLTRLRSGQLVYRKLTAWEGPITVVPAEFDGHFVSPEFPTFTLDTERVDLDVMRLICTSPAFHGEMKAVGTGTAERRNRVKPEDLLEIEVELPEIDEQRLVGKLCRLADSLVAEADAATTLSRAMVDKVILSTAGAG